jgi:serine protease inhibitor
VLYFNSKWRKEFNKKLEQQTFFKLGNNPNNRITSTYMFGEVSGGYLQTSTGTEILSLPFEDDNYAMVFVLPQTGILLVLMTTNK